MRWEPWEDDRGKEDLVRLDIPEPPCKECIFWKPHRQYITTTKGAIFDGVQCCVSDEQFHDFSCYRPKET